MPKKKSKSLQFEGSPKITDAQVTADIALASAKTTQRAAADRKVIKSAKPGQDVVSIDPSTPNAPLVAVDHGKAPTEGEKREASRQQTFAINKSRGPIWGTHEGDPELDPRLNPNFLALVHPSKHAAVIADFPMLDPVTQAQDNPKVEAPEKETSVGDKGGRRFALYGHPVTAVIRWMGIDAWTFAQARKCLDALDLKVADPTIRAQLRAGVKGERGAPAELTEEQVAELNRLSGQ